MVSGALTRHPIKMGLRNRNLITEPATFFVTTSTYNHKKHFTSSSICNKITDLIVEAAIDHSVVLMSYVIMPNHFHLIVGCKKGGMQLSKFMHSIKGRIRSKLFGNQKIWQDRFDDLIIRSKKQFNIKINYIHENPVRSGLVKSADEYISSSAKAWQNRKSDFLTFDFDWL